jgi:hypothetical protein
MFVLKALTDRGRSGISAAAYWQNGTSKVTEHAAAIKSGHRYPSYSEAIIKSIDNNDDKQALTIICSSRVDLGLSLQNQDSTMMTPAQVERNKDDCVENGITISDDIWHEINRIGAGILVENTQNSRADAGGS